MQFGALIYNYFNEKLIIIYFSQGKLVMMLSDLAKKFEIQNDTISFRNGLSYTIETMIVIYN